MTVRFVTNVSNDTARDRRRAPLIRFGWARVLLCMVLYLALWTTLRVFVGPTFSRFAAGLNGVLGMGASSWFSLLFSAGTVYLPMIVSVAVCRRFVDRRSFSTLGFRREALPQKIGFGVLTAIAAVCLVFLISLILEIIVLHPGTSGGRGFAGVALVQHLVLAFAEELLMLGYVVTNLRGAGRGLLAAVVSALIFAAAHCLNPNLSVVGALNLFLGGLAMALYFIRTDDIVAPIAAHWMWNFVQGPVLGYSVSGLDVTSLLSHSNKGSALLTGGGFGFEGSVLTTSVLLLIIAAVALFPGWMRRSV